MWITNIISYHITIISLICCWILFARILLKIFASMFISDIGLQFSLFVAPLPDFSIRVMVASQSEFGSLPSSAIFWKSLSRIGVRSYLNFWQNLPVKPSGPGHFCWKSFDYNFNFHVFDGPGKIFYYFLIHFWKVILFQEFVHFFQVVHFIGIYLLMVVSYDPLYFCVVCCDFSIFVSNFVLFFLFFLTSLIICLFVFSKNQLLVLLIFAVVSISFSVISALIFMIYFLLLTLGFFFSSFYSCFRCKVRLFI